MVYEQHPPLADCSSARFAPVGFEVFTPGDCDGPSQRLDIAEVFPRVACDSTHPIIIKHSIADLEQDVPCRLLKRQFHVLSGARASLYE